MRVCRLRRRRAASTVRPAVPAPSVEPIVLTVTRPLTRQTADLLAREVETAEPSSTVVVDLTGIPSFDIEGTEALVGLQDEVGTDRLTIVGLRQATARLTGMPVAAAPTALADVSLPVTRLQHTAVVRAREGVPLDPLALQAAITSALADDVAILVVDLREVPTLDTESAGVLAFASSEAAVRGSELLVVNVDAADAELLRLAGLSGTTYVAPAPLD